MAGHIQCDFADWRPGTARTARDATHFTNYRFRSFDPHGRLAWAFSEGGAWASAANAAAHAAVAPTATTSSNYAREATPVPCRWAEFQPANAATLVHAPS